MMHIPHISDFWRKPWSTVFGVLLGGVLVLASPSWLGPVIELYDESHPVASPVSAVVTARESDSVILRLVIEKHFGDECRPLRIYGYSIVNGGITGLARVTRPDGSPHASIPHDKGVVDLGLWRVKPVDQGAEKVTVYTEHACVGRVIRSKIAEVPL